MAGNEASGASRAQTGRPGTCVWKQLECAGQTICPQCLMSAVIDVQTPGRRIAGAEGAGRSIPRRVYATVGRATIAFQFPILHRNESETPRNSMHHNAQNTPNRPAKVSDLKPKGGKGSADKGRGGRA